MTTDTARRGLEPLFKKNREWAERMITSDPQFFRRLAERQTPRYLWIGCSDSRVPANQIMGLLPGDVFVHRNVANVVIHTDLNFLSVLQYAVEVLRVEEIIVCGHYGCGGVRAALENRGLGLIDNWLRNIKDIYQNCREDLAALPGERERVDRLCELNVIAQVGNVAHTAVVQEAWRRGAQLAVHGLVYSIEDGILRDLKASVDSPEKIAPIYRLTSEAAGDA